MIAPQEYQYKTNLSPEQRKVYAARQRRLLMHRISGGSEPIWATREDALAQQMLPKLNVERTTWSAWGMD